VPKGAKVQMHYTGKLEDGKEFDSSHSRGRPIKFTLGSGQVIKGWDMTVSQMNVGEKAVLTIPSEYAYGERGVPGIIPPNQTLSFEVEIIDFE
jgi:FK506-binding protein 1